MSPSFYWGFLADNKSISGVLWYLVEISGFFFVGMIVAAVFLKRSQRAVLMGCLLPMVFAFLVSLTPDINVNHKYVMISYAFCDSVLGDGALDVFSLREKKAGRNGPVAQWQPSFVSALVQPGSTIT